MHFFSSWTIWPKVKATTHQIITTNHANTSFSLYCGTTCTFLFIQLARNSTTRSPQITASSAWLSWDWAPFPVSACVHLDLVKITWYFSEDVLHTFQKEHKLLFENSCTTFPKCNSVRCTYMQTRNQIMNLLYILDEVHTWLPKRVLCNICSLTQSKYCSSNKCLRWTRFLCRRASAALIYYTLHL